MNREEKLEKLLKHLGPVFGDVEGIKATSPFEHMVLAILASECGAGIASKAARALLSEFVDWNEVRVSSWKEIGLILEKAKIPFAGDKAISLKRSLEAVFSETNRMDLGSIEKMPKEKAVNLMLKLKDMDEGGLAAVLYRSLGIDTLIPTPKVVRVAQRMGFIQKNASAQKMKQNLSSFVREKALYRFHYYLGKLADKCCFEKAAFCSACPALLLCQQGAVRARAQEDFKDDPKD